MDERLGFFLLLFSMDSGQRKQMYLLRRVLVFKLSGNSSDGGGCQTQQFVVPN